MSANNNEVKSRMEELTKSLRKLYTEVGIPEEDELGLEEHEGRSILAGVSSDVADQFEKELSEYRRLDAIRKGGFSANTSAHGGEKVKGKTSKQAGETKRRSAYTDVNCLEKTYLKTDREGFRQLLKAFAVANPTLEEYEYLRQMINEVPKDFVASLREDVEYKDLLATKADQARVEVHSVLFMAEYHKKFPGECFYDRDGICFYRMKSGVQEKICFVRGVPRSEKDAALASDWLSTPATRVIFPYIPSSNKVLGAAYACLIHTSDKKPNLLPSSLLDVNTKVDNPLSFARQLAQEFNVVLRKMDKVKSTKLDVVNEFQKVLNKNPKWVREAEEWVKQRRPKVVKDVESLAPVTLPNPSDFPRIIASLKESKSKRNMATGSEVRHRLVNTFANTAYDAPHLQLATAFSQVNKPKELHVIGDLGREAQCMGEAVIKALSPQDVSLVQCEHVCYRAITGMWKTWFSEDGGESMLLRSLSNSRRKGLQLGKQVSVWFNVLDRPDMFNPALKAELANWDLKNVVSSGGLHTPFAVATFVLRALDPKIIEPEAYKTLATKVAVMLAVCQAGDNAFNIMVENGVYDLEFLPKYIQLKVKASSPPQPLKHGVAGVYYFPEIGRLMNSGHVAPLHEDADFDADILDAVDIDSSV